MDDEGEGFEAEEVEAEVGRGEEWRWEDLIRDYADKTSRRKVLSLATS
jgi:hypothetical protein